MAHPNSAAVLRSLVSTTFAAVLFSGLPASAAQFSWGQVTGAWSLNTNWTSGTVPPSAADTELLFGGSGATAYTATNDIAGVFQLNKLTLNSSATVTETIAGNSLSFISNGATTPVLTQSGVGTFAISSNLAATNALTLGGSGTGLVTLSGVISGAGGLTFTGGMWQLTSTANSFTGGVTIKTGSYVELLPAGAAPQNVSFATGATSLLGGNTSNPLTIDGGTLKLTSTGAGNVALGAARPVTFASNGGTLDITNVSGSPTAQGGNIASGDLALTLNNAAGSPAVVRWNGGQLGLSNNNATNGDWTLGTNALRISSLSGSGPLRIELTNGALLRGSIATGAVDNNIANPLTIRGVVGGDPTSGPDGTIATGVSLNTGRIQYDSNRVNYNGGLTLEGAMAINPANRTTAINGNITVASNGYVAFQGRGTGTGVSNAIQNPGSTTNPGHNVLWIGENASTTLTVQNGGIAVFDGRNRIDQANAHGVLLGGNAVLEAGGTLRIAQSISNYSNIPTTVASNFNTTQNEGDIILRGNITGKGTTANESLLDIKLPAPDASGTIANGTPTPLTATTPAAGSRPFAGLVAESTHSLIINGSGFGGLRVTASARPDRLFSATGVAGGDATPDPTSNVTKLNSYLTATRLASVTGSGGYLTPAANGGAWTFPSGGEWASGVSVGLRVMDSNANGPDVVMGPSTWSHNLAIDAGATLDTGANAFTLNAGTLHGKGSIAGAGGVVIGGTAAVSPGLGDIGTLSGERFTLQGTAKLMFDLSTANNSSDRLTLSGAFTKGSGGPFLFDFGGGGLAGQTYTLVQFASTTFTAADFTASNLAAGLSGSFQVTPTEVRFAVVPEPGAAVSLMGGMAMLLGWHRRKR